MQLKKKRTIAQKVTAIARSIRKFGDPDGDRTPKLTAIQQAARAMGQKGGKSKSPAKVEAARANGKRHTSKAHQVADALKALLTDPHPEQDETHAATRYAQMEGKE